MYNFYNTKAQTRCWIIPAFTQLTKSLNHLSNYYLQLLRILYFCLMKVNIELVDKLAHLSRLQFNDLEKEQVQADLQKMIQFVEKLNELDTTGVAPLLHMSDGINVLREDEVKGSITRAEALQNAPQQDGVFFKVPKVIKRDEG